MKKNFTVLMLLLLSVFVKAQIVNIPDANFKAKLLAASPLSLIAKDENDLKIKIDTNNDSEIQESEALAVYSLSVGSSNIADLTGINAFLNLKSLSVQTNQLTSLDVSALHLEGLNAVENNLTSLNLTGLSALKSLYFNDNQVSGVLDVTSMPELAFLQCNSNLLTAINITGLSQLKHLECSENQIASLDVSGSPLLNYLWCDYNNLTTLDVTMLPLLTSFNCSYNQLTSLKVDHLPNLRGLLCGFNQLTVLDLTGSITNNSGLNTLSCRNNQITTLDISDKDLNSVHVSNNPLTSLKLGQLNSLYCYFTSLTSIEVPFPAHYISVHDNPQLQSLYVKNGGEDVQYVLTNAPNLSYICADESDMATIQQELMENNITGCEVNSYCVPNTDTPYDIILAATYDTGSDGCGNEDFFIPGQKFTIDNGNSSGTIIVGASGNSILPVSAGTHVVTPVFESAYFSTSPANSSITFPGLTSVVTQNFCVAPNATHPDIEITMINNNTAIPGFDADYTVICKNKGTTTASGFINVSFDDDILDFVTAEPAANASLNELSWVYSDLKPFGSYAIHFTMNLNSPVENPPLHQGDNLTIVAYSAFNDDETPSDNIMALNQPVFNAIDPNDKTCLEGDTITPQMIGEYVHYKIRFENTGNYPAAIVTVKDVIDTSKFDISTLTPIAGSHHFITRITNNNQVEFIFDNIMLPFDDANNDGYVIFKIKTKPTLVLGDQLSNTAGIYFNYNAPVVTNTAVTTVALPLGIDDENTFGFVLYPNPVKDVLNISSKLNANIDSIEINNMLGQEVMKVLPANGDYGIDVSRLPIGSYIIKVTSGNGSWTSKFIKE
ncbi:T9SS type A sorting domain-containing protein [Flavobacterium pallidum]|nr:T9SS type A sorting domain-containing protein [Flavobacterium pallidum]